MINKKILIALQLLVVSLSFASAASQYEQLFLSKRSVKLTDKDFEEAAAKLDMRDAQIDEALSNTKSYGFKTLAASGSTPSTKEYRRNDGSLYPTVRYYKKEDCQAAEQAELVLEVTKNIAQKNKYSYADVCKLKIPDNKCPGPYRGVCDFRSPYRTIDGSCNNERVPWWGKASTNFNHILDPEYNDGYDEPRSKSVTGADLPNARSLALIFHYPNDKFIGITSHVVQFGQFIAHDFSLNLPNQLRNEGGEVHCSCGVPDPRCINIPTPSEDYLNKDQKCMIMARSAPALKSYECTLGYRQQNNLNTAWLDLSQTYGSDDETAMKLRTKYDGLLEWSDGKDGQVHLPIGPPVFGVTGPCYFAGDGRVNENPILSAITTLWLREHNRLATKLKELNPHWNDETLYQVARKINIAEFQHITYNEWLPIILGKRIMKLFNLFSKSQGYSTTYNSAINPATYTETMAAAFRFGHLMLRYDASKMDRYFKPSPKKSMVNILMDTTESHTDSGPDGFMRGLFSDNANWCSRHMNDAHLNHLFEVGKDNPSETKRYSLLAVNIQRGRDHGVAGYIKYREYCGLGRANSFDDLTNIPEKSRQDLAKLYAHVADIDLYTGASAEYPVEGGLIGPTFACIIAQQFYDWKHGDRYWYEIPHQPQGFTPAQLYELKKVVHSRLICDNMDIDAIQVDSFFPADRKRNPILDCDHIQNWSLEPWREVLPYSG